MAKQRKLVESQAAPTEAERIAATWRAEKRRLRPPGKDDWLRFATDAEEAAMRVAEAERNEASRSRDAEDAKRIAAAWREEEEARARGQRVHPTVVTTETQNSGDILKQEKADAEAAQTLLKWLGGSGYKTTVTRQWWSGKLVVKYQNNNTIATWPLDSASFREWLAQRYEVKHGYRPTPTAISRVIEVLRTQW